MRVEPGFRASGGCPTRAVVLLLLVLAPPASALGGCAVEGDFDVCWDDTGDTVADAGAARAETYTGRREGSGTGDYTVVRDGVRVTAPLTTASAEVAEYTYVEDEDSVHAREVRVAVGGTGGTHVAAGLRRATFGSVEVCDAYVQDSTLDTPCTDAHP